MTKMSVSNHKESIFCVAFLYILIIVFLIFYIFRILFSAGEKFARLILGLKFYLTLQAHNHIYNITLELLNKYLLSRNSIYLQQ